MTIGFRIAAQTYSHKVFLVPNVRIFILHEIGVLTNSRVLISNIIIAFSV